MTECEITEIHCMLLASGLNGVHVGGALWSHKPDPTRLVDHLFVILHRLSTFDVMVINGWQMGGVWFTGALGGFRPYSR